MKTYNVIGIMSGTSLDGLDLAYCSFSFDELNWNYKIHVAETIAYNATWKKRLGELHKQPMFLLPKTDAYFGKYIGQCVNTFISKHKLTVDFISSHGHTIFHNPAENYTTQIGSGAAIYAETGIATICDFRSVDVALGGQGAPLVPIGDELLFAAYDACLNLGGFANISFTESNQRKAFDICACNIILNHYVGFVDKAFDDKGKISASGTVNPDLLNALNNLPYYETKGAKSLGREWVETALIPLLHQFELTIPDYLNTLTEHIAQQIAKTLTGKILVTGGGAYNDFLLMRLRAQTNAQIIIPDDETIQFKEALIFAFLGVLRINNLPNAIKEVTKANKSSVGGAIYGNI